MIDSQAQKSGASTIVIEKRKEGEPGPENISGLLSSDRWEVQFIKGDPENPKNWSVKYRFYLTAVAGITVLNATFASSAPSGITEDMIKTFGISHLVATLVLSIFVAGFCVGPLVWAPLSESYGRRPVYIVSYTVYLGMQIGCALSTNTAAILVFRFLGGCFSAAPITNSGGMIADIWDVDHRGQAMSIYALAPFAGPSIGPIVAGYIHVSGTDWRWVFWILAIFSGICLLVLVFTVPETYVPRLLVQKALRLRKETNELRWIAPAEHNHSSWKSFFREIVFKPFKMIALEPMLLAVTLYMSFLYGLVYLLFEAYPFVFIENHGFNVGQQGLAFLAFFFGGCLSVIFFMTILEPRYQRHVKMMAPLLGTPEKRLELSVISAWLLVVAMFWFAWTSFSSIHWISPVLAGGLIGMGVLGINVSLFNYVVDVYITSAASALAGPTVIRSFFGFGFPLFAVQMYDRLGPQWATSLLGFFILAMAPIPWCLTVYGAKLRERSRFLTEHLRE